MKKLLSQWMTIGALGLILLLPVRVAAAGNLGSALGNLTGVGTVAGTTEGSVESIVGRIIRGALTLIGTIFFVLMVYAGYLWLTARGQEDKVEKSKQIIQASIIGLVIVVSAYAISVFVTTQLAR